ncbi:MAG: LptF/LptG family permease [Bacteroidetes bacterium]|nr:LptF/LptG family permease [Bacteroidota bacterium]
MNRPMSTLDRYIIGKFFGTFAFMLGIFCMIVLVFDLMEHIGRLVDHGAPIGETLLYYVNVCFHFGSLLAGFIVFLTIIWFTSRLAQNSEIIAMLAGGMPFRRLMRPYILASGMLMLLLMAISHWVVPRANAQKLAFEQSYIHTSVHVQDKNLYREVAPGTIVYFRSVNYERATGYKFQLEQWDGDVLKQRILAAKATFSPSDSMWRLVNVGVRDFREDGSQHHRFLTRLDTALTMRVDDFAERNEVVATMRSGELKSYIEEVRSRGADTSNLELALHSRTATPFAMMVLTLIGVSIAARRLRGGLGLHLFAAVLIGFTFVFASKVISVWASAAVLPSWFPLNEQGLRLVAAWLPNALFAGLGFWLYAKAPK